MSFFISNNRYNNHMNLEQGYPVKSCCMENYKLSSFYEGILDEAVFCAKSLSPKQGILINDLIEMLENINQVLSAKNRFENVGRI